LHLARGAGNGDSPGFDRLAQGFEHVTVELRQFVQKQHSVMRERNLPGAGNLAATDERGSRGRCGAAREKGRSPQRAVSKPLVDTECTAATSSACSPRGRQDARKA